jgi:hypothetical protein
MIKFDFFFTLKIIFIAIIVYLFVTSWGNFLDKLFFRIFKLDPEAISSWFIISIVSTIILILILYFYHIEAHDLLGISEVVDNILTHEKEIIINGDIVNTKII